MATFCLIRHGEPDYAPCAARGFIGHGRSLAPLTPRGIAQAERAARDPRLEGARIIVASPLTRALQTAAIIARHTGLPLQVEVDLREWEPDMTYQFASAEDAEALAASFARHRGVHPPGEAMRWETLAAMRERVRAVADRYALGGHAILVSHGMALRTLARVGRMQPGEIAQCSYEAGQADCVYDFF